MSATNVTSGEEEEDEETQFALWVLILCGILIVILILFAIIGNILTIAAYIRDKHLRTVYNMYIVNLAVTDLLIGSFSMTIYSTYDLSSYHWHFGYHFCKTFLVIDFTLCLESVLIMFIISLDRLLLLRFGSHYEQRVTPRKAFLAIALSWCLAFLLYSPAIVGYDHWSGTYAIEDGDCDLPFVNDYVYTVVTAVMEFLLPLIGISVSNILIYIEIRKRSKLSRVSPTEGNMNGSSSRHQNSNANDQGVAVISKHKTLPRRDIKAAKFLASLVVLFLLTWAPYTICTVVMSFSEDLVSDHVYEILTWMLWSKASLNPFLYAFNSVRFRKNFKDIRDCLLRRKRTVDITQSMFDRSAITQT